MLAMDALSHVFLFVDRFWDWGRGTGLEAGGAWTGVSEWR